MVEKSKKIGFVILHYNARKTTETCVSKILSLKNSKIFEIIIVDNNSPDRSGNIIKNEYENFPNIHVLINIDNLGFAKGNNVGFDYLKENFDLDFMIVMNNDVLISDENFVSKIYENYNSEKFDVLGPDIYIPRTFIHQNPFRNSSLTYEEMKKMRSFFRPRSKLFFFFFMWNKIRTLLKKSLSNNNEINENKKSLSLNKSDMNLSKNIIMDQENDFVLHGACYIFSKNFIKKRDYAFWPGTFMFFEEDILQYECKNENFRMIFCPSIQVTHLEDISTNTVMKSNYKKNRFKYKQFYNSLNNFLNTFYKCKF